VQRMILVLAVAFGIGVTFTLPVLGADASDTHRQIQKSPVTRNRPGVPESCVSFDPATAHIGRFTDTSSTELVVDPLRRLCKFTDGDQAARALKALRRYGMNEYCTVAHSKLSYMLVSGEAPKGTVQGEKYVLFDPAGLRVEQHNGEWKLVSNKSCIFAFGSDEEAARQALQAIRHYGFNAKSSLGGEAGGLEYLAVAPTPKATAKKSTATRSASLK
jgi:hypothetical protein